MGGRWRVKKREMNTYAPVALLSQQYFKPHLTVIAAEEGGETVEEGGEIRGDGYHAEGIQEPVDMRGETGSRMNMTGILKRCFAAQLIWIKCCNQRRGKNRIFLYEILHTLSA